MYILTSLKKLFLTLSVISLVSGPYALAESEETVGSLDQAELAMYYFEANIASKLGNEEESEAYYQKIISYHTSILNNANLTYDQQIQTLKEIGRIKNICGCYEETIQLYKDFLSNYPQNSDISNALAETFYLQAMQYANKNQVDLGIDAALSILDINDLYSLSRIWPPFIKDYVASLYIAEGDAETALYWYQRIISDHPDFKHWPALAHFSIAKYHLRRKDYKKAKEHLQEILSDYPDSSWAEPAQEKLRSVPSE